MIDLRTEQLSGTWVRRFGEHETHGFGVSIGNKSAHVTLTALGIAFVVDRQDVPAAWSGSEPIDVIKLREELIATVVRHMSPEVLEALFGEIHTQRQRAFCEGDDAAKTKIKAALGL